MWMDAMSVVLWAVLMVETSVELWDGMWVGKMAVQKAASMVYLKADLRAEKSVGLLEYQWVVQWAV